MDTVPSGHNRTICAAADADSSILLLMLTVTYCCRCWQLHIAADANSYILLQMLTVPYCCRCWQLHIAADADSSILLLMLTVIYCCWCWQFHTAADADSYILLLMLTVTYCRWCWQLHTAADADSYILPLMLTVTYCCWCWQSCTATDADSHVLLLMLTVMYCRWCWQLRIAADTDSYVLPLTVTYCRWCWQLRTATDADSYIHRGIHTHMETEETAWKVHTNKEVLSSTEHASSKSPASNLTPSQLPQDSSCQGCSESDNINFSNSGKGYISWSSHANDELETVKWEEKRKSTRESAAVFSRASFFRKAWGGIKNWFCNKQYTQPCEMLSFGMWASKLYWKHVCEYQLAGLFANMI